MKSLTQLKQYYQSILLPELQVLEGLRKKALKKIIIGIAITVPLTLVGAVFAPPLIFLGIIGILLIVRMTTRTYVAQFKTDIIAKIVSFVDENLRYQRSHYIPQALFSASQIFRHRIDRYQGDDYVSGILGKTKVEFSELHAQYVVHDSKGRSSYHTIFKGLFFIADFNKNFSGRTIVLPDTAERLFGNIGSIFQSWNKMRGELIKLEDPAFEKEFVVYGSDQIEARYILSTSLMRRILDFKRKTRKRLHLSFVGSKIFIAISYRRNLFEPRVFRTLLDFEPIQQYFDDLQVAAGIVEELNLNTRIWGKQ